MATIFENMGAKTELGSGLAAGVETISYNQEVVFTLYVQVVMPIDGYVFWVNAALLTDTAIYNATQYSKLLYDRYENPNGAIPARQIKAKGSLHYSTENNQLQDRTNAFNNVTFTSLQPIEDFNAINPTLMYVSQKEDFKFAFNSRASFYKQADLYHYGGHGLYSIMDTQLVDSMDQLDLSQPIVSNSLPIWLSLNQFFPVYPSYLVAQNIAPPYAVIDIDPSQTTALGQTQIVKNVFLTNSTSAVAGYAIAGEAKAGDYIVESQSTIDQLSKDTVKIIIFGANNNTALNFVNYINQYSENGLNLGIMNLPIIQDEKVTQSDFNIIAQKKIVTFEVSYYQSTVNTVALKLIFDAFMSVNVANL